MKNLPYTQLIIDKVIKELEKPTESKLPETAQGTEFQTGYEMGKNETIDRLKVIKID